MKKRPNPINIPEVVLKRWWWRRLVFVEFDEETHTTSHRRVVPNYPNYGFSVEWSMWHRSDELFAYRYELLRRVMRLDLPEWHELPAWQYSWIAGALSPKQDRATCGGFYPTIPDGYVSLDNWAWDLTASDEALCEQFLARINEARVKHGLPDTGDIFYGLIGPKLSHKEKRRGERNRSVSWMAVEVLDLLEHKVRTLTDGERSRVSKVRREILKYRDSMLKALSNTVHLMSESNRTQEPATIYSRFIDENFRARLASRLPKG